MLTNTYKVYNSQTLASVYITGYHLIKDLAARGENKQCLQYAMRQLNKNGRYFNSPLSIDLVRI